MRTQTICLTLAIVVLCSTAPAQWARLPIYVSEQSIVTVGTNLYVVALEHGNAILLRSGDNGNHWDTLSVVAFPGGRSYPPYWGRLIAVDTILVTEVYHGQRSFIVRSTDGGRTWIDTAHVTEVLRQFLQVGSRLYSFSGGTYSGDSGKDTVRIRSSTNRGMTWDTVRQSAPLKGLFGQVLSKGALVFCSMLDEGLFSCTPSEEGWVWTLSSWGTKSAVSALELLGDTLFCVVSWPSGSSNSMYRSIDDGKTWIQAGSGLEMDGAVPSIPSLWSFRGLLFAASESGLFVSNNRGDSWRFWGEGLPRDPFAAYHSFPYCRVRSMAFSDSFAFIGSNDSLWRRPLSEMTTSVSFSSSQLPVAFDLKQNYPNPFNPSTTIRYGLPHKSAVQLTVFNTLGQQVATLVQGDQEAGYHEVRFDASGLSSGVYFYRLQAGDFTQTKRLMLLK